ncbi:MAG: hypothetical protein GF308_16275 [Candidatus Heimdallarchaeota archaeon]|nr:hypothetical protein [Candidatus Heimdallarchaeota archaeon]
MKQEPVKLTETVIKIGGSITEKGTPEDLRALGKILRDCFQVKANFVVIPGGGEFAETVRDVQQKFQFDDEQAHWMAILAMEQQGFLLNYFVPQSQLINYPREFQQKAKELLNTRTIPILKIWDYMQTRSSLPHDWSATSDAITTEIAQAIKAKNIIFVKDVDGVRVNKQIKKEITVTELQNLEKSPLDPLTPKIMKRNKCQAIILNGFYPMRLKKILIENNYTIPHTRIIH